MSSHWANIWSKASRWMGIWLFVGSVLGVLALFSFFTRLPAPISLDDMLPRLSIACGSAGRPQLEVLSLFAGQSRWMAFALLLITVAAVALVVAVVTIVAIAREAAAPREEGHSQATIVLGLIGLAVTLVHIYSSSGGEEPGTGFLSSLLSTVPSSEPGCGSLRAMVLPMRTIGQGAALMVGAAMAATAAHTSEAPTVARRIEQLQLLLYCASLLFVAGILVSESNFTWITSQWAGYPRDESVAKATEAIIRAGTLQSGVAYSAMLVIFFLPARSYLAWQAQQVSPKEEQADRAKEKKRMEDAGLVGSWRDDLKQILALLAPLLSAPLFDAIAR